MEQILVLIKGNSIPDIRSSFYYLGRYIKQASYFEEYQKNIFDDDDESSPTELVKELTFRLIEVIEQIAGKKAKYFDTKEYVYWMKIVNGIEEELDPNPSNELFNRATDELNKFDVPKR